MKIIKNDLNIETIIFSDNVEPEIITQLNKLINFGPYTRSKIRLMPDVHTGKGCMIGTTMTIADKLTPNFVGVDIGCGMLTVKLKDENIDFSKLDKVIRHHVPNGNSVHNKPKAEFDFSGLKIKDKLNIKRAACSIGSLGSGNHFIEIGQSQNTGNLFLIIHTGSRHLGTEVCEYYQDIAIKHTFDNYPDLVLDNNFTKDFCFLEGNDFHNYLNDMQIVQNFAIRNRQKIAEIIFSNMDFTELYNFETIHNYIDFDRMILRKGAVRAELNEELLIPINMRDGSLLCRGKGNANWNYSAPHGAGRLMSRTKALANIKLEDFETAMQGIYSSCINKSTIDEAPQAYKSIDEITSQIDDTVEIIDKIKTIYNFKAY